MCNDPILHAPQQSRLPHELVEEALASDEVGGSIKLLDLAMVEHDDAVGVEDGVNAVSNYRANISMNPPLHDDHDLLVIMVRSLNILLRSVVCNMASVSTSTAAVASSRTRILLGVSSARASETSWRWP